MSIFGRIRCQNCPTRTQGVAACEVPHTFDVVFVGEAPGRKEAEKGRPFVGPSGDLLRSLVKKYVGSAAFINVVSCRPPNNKMTKEHYAACFSLFETRLKALLERGTETVFVALGATAAKAFGLKGAMSELVDQVHETEYGPVYVMYHPAYILRKRTFASYEISFQRLAEYLRTRSTSVLIDKLVEEAPHSIANSEEEVVDYLHTEGKVVVDLETWGDNPFDPKHSDVTMIALYAEGRDYALIVPASLVAERVKESVRNVVLEGRAIFHNAKFDVRYMIGKGWLQWKNVLHPAFQYEDTKLITYVLNEDGVEFGSGKKGEKGSHGLKPLTMKYLGVSYSGGELYSATPGAPEWYELAEYAARDVLATYRIYARERHKMDAYDQKLYDFLREASMALAYIESCGVLVDVDELERLEAELENVRTSALERMRTICGDDSFNPRSTKQLRAVLYGKFGFPVLKETETGLPSTDVETVGLLSDHTQTEEQKEFLSALLEYRKADKIIGTYIGGWKKRLWDDGRLHPSFHETGTVTGRLSSSNPNLQNVAKHSDVGKLLRKAVVSPDGHVIVEVDGSQMEVRVFAALSGDKVYTEALLAGEDIHAAVARSIFGEAFDQAPPEERKELRSQAKRTTFGVLYGMGPETLAKQIGQPEEVAARILSSYYASHPEVLEYRRKRMNELLRNGYVLTPVTGRKRRIRYIPREGTKEYEELAKHIWNAEVQGLASDVNLRVATNLVQRWHDKGVQFFALIHDAIVAYVPEEFLEEYVQDALDEFSRVGKEWFGEAVPIVGEAELGYNWAEMKELDEFKEEQHAAQNQA